MKITDVSLTLFAWDDIPPTQYGQHSKFAGSSALGLLRIATDDVVEGHAFLARPRTRRRSTGRPDHASQADADGPQSDASRGAVVDLWKRQRPAGVRTIGAVDVALWDLRARHSASRSIACSAPIANRLPAYASSAVLASAGAYAEQAVEFKENGWAAYKSIRRRAGARTIKVCEAVRTPSATTPSCSIRPGPMITRRRCVSTRRRGDGVPLVRRPAR